MSLTYGPDSEAWANRIAEATRAEARDATALHGGVGGAAGMTEAQRYRRAQHVNAVTAARSEPLTAAQRLGVAMREARQARHMTVAQLATAIGISESACRRLEDGESKNCRGETLLAVLAWAESRRIRRMGDWECIDDTWHWLPVPEAESHSRIGKAVEPDTPETVAAKCASARRIGEMFAEMFK
jgi:transcriptional regulator with XRE-family HTH domain